MQTVHFVMFSLLCAAVIWILNFTADAKLAHSTARGIHSQETLVPAEGRQHVIVTGGAGFIGSHAAMTLLAEGHAVTVLDNLSRGNPGALLQLSLMAPAQRFKFIMVDLGEREAVHHVFRHLIMPKADLVIHFAAIAYVAESVAEPIRYYKNVTVATTYLLEAMIEQGVNKLVYSSTCAVYGNQDKLPITEESVPKPNTPYGESKLMAEQVIRATARANPALQAVILRYFNVYGSDPQGRLGEWPRPEMRQHSRISGACLDAAMGLIPSLTIKGTKHPTPDGTCVRDYIHVLDLISAHVLAMEHLANPPALFNVGSGKPVSVRQFVDACKAVTGAKIEVIEQAEARPGDYAEVWASTDKIQIEMGWRPNYTDVSDGLKHAWAWRTAHPDGYGRV